MAIHSRICIRPDYQDKLWLFPPLTFELSQGCDYFPQAYVFTLLARVDPPHLPNYELRFPTIIYPPALELELDIYD